MEVVGAITGIMSCLCTPNCLHRPFLQKMNYLKKPELHAEKLRSKMEELTARANDINTKMEIAKLQEGKEPKAEVLLWLKNVKKIENELFNLLEEIENETKCLNGCAPDYSARLRLGKRIHEKLKVLDALLEKGQFSDDSLADSIPEKGSMLPTVTIVGKTTAEKSFEEIWGYLTDDETGRIGVYGMGGVGKTTIMKQINNRLLNETTRFDNVIWVTVSKEPNLKKLQKNIAKAMDLDILQEDELRRAARILKALQRRKRFVLILDDLWEVFPLEDIGIPSPTRENGCKLVLTTRLLGVCRGMETQKDVEVKVLSEEEAWNLFKEKVGNDVLLSSDIERIAMKVIKECGGLPLAIITVGRALRKVNDVAEWKNALTELQGSSMKQKGMEDTVFARLNFSYRRLRDDITRDCLLYCALYPEDYLIETKQLIEYWIWEGLIVDMGKIQTNMLKGKVIVNELKDSCLLESVGEYRGVEYVKMHDLIRDMAIDITRTKPRFIIKAGLGLSNLPNEEEWLEDVQRVSLMRNDLKLLSGQPNCNKLSTLLIQYNSISKDISHSFFLNMRNLKVLDLSYTGTELLPESISSLQNLSALLLGNCWNLGEVPSLVKLGKLKVLDLSYTPIKELPQGMHMLRNLRRLDISYTHIERFPAGYLKMLRHLEELLMAGTRFWWGSYAIYEKGSGFVGDLIKFMNLAILEINFWNSKTLDRYTRSGHWNQLESFKILIGYSGDLSQLGKRGITVSREQLLVRGCPVLLPSNTSCLHINDCPDITRLSMCLLNVTHLIECKIRQCEQMECILFTGENNLPTLEKLELTGLSNLRMLCKGVVPSDTLRCLKNLDVAECHSLKQLFSPGLSQHLQNLEVLEVGFCKGMHEIMTTEEEAVGEEEGEEEDEDEEEIVEEIISSNATVINLPRLQKLELKSLPRLKSIYKGVMVCDSLHTIRVVNSPRLKRLPLSIGNGQTPPAALKQIIGSRIWWHSLQWEQPDAIPFFLQFQIIEEVRLDYSEEEEKERKEAWKREHLSCFSQKDISPAVE